MRVLLLTEASSAGVGRHVIDLARGLLAEGCDVHLVYSEARIDSNFRTGLEELSAVRTATCEMRRAPHPTDIKALRAIRAYVKANGPFDVIHAHSSKGGALARMLGRGHGASVVYTPHCMYTVNPDLGSFSRLLTASIERSLAYRTDAIVAVSPSERDHMAELGIPEKRLRCIPNGVDPLPVVSRAEIRERFALTEDVVAVGFLGRLSAQKDPSLMVRSFALVAEAEPAARLLMVGTGELETDARRTADELGVADRVLWLGHQRPENVMPGFDVFVMPSRYEAMPYVLLEALVSGLPIVSTAVGGSRVAIEPGQNGTITRERTPEAIASALLPLVRDRNLRRSASEASLVRARQFSIAAMVRTTLDLYDELRGLHTVTPVGARA